MSEELNIEPTEENLNDGESQNEQVEELVVDNKYLAIYNWVKTYEPLEDGLYFNVILDEPDTASVNSVSNGVEINTFIDGTKEVEYLFAVSIQREFDPAGTSSVNVTKENEFDDFAKWVEEQSEEQNFPDFGDKITIEKIEPTQTAPMVTVDTNNQVAKYLGQFKITYLEER